MEDELTFDNLYALLDKFSKTSETNKKFAETLSQKISSGIRQNDFHFNNRH